MLYRILKFIFSYAVGKYFVKINVLHSERIPKDKPVLLLPNHRSAFMDPILVATQVDRVTHFLTRGESFNTPLAIKVFKRLHMIPIFRKEHNPEKVDQNEDIFRYCHNLMEENGCLMIFPEGICQTKYLLAPVKTGAARIALEAEAKNDFNLDIHVVPVGINYSNPHRFRGNVTLEIGEPIRPADYQEAFTTDYWDGVQQLTNAIEDELRKRIIILEDQDQMQVIQKIEALTNRKNEELDLGEMDWFSQRQAIAERLIYYNKQKPESFASFTRRLNTYFKVLNRLGVNQSYDPNREIGLSSRRNVWLTGILLVLLSPVFLIGFALHIIPFRLTRFLSLRLTKRVDFLGSVALALGILIFTIFGATQTVLIHKLFGNGWITAAFFFVWPSLGLFAYAYLAELVKWLDRIRWIRLGLRRKGLQSRLAQERKALLKLIVDMNDYVTRNRHPEETAATGN